MTLHEHSQASKSNAALLSISSNVLLILLKAMAGLVTGSVAILSDAIQSGMDLIASVITFYSVKHSDSPADENHHYGHEKLEDVSAGLEAMLLMGGAAVIIVESIHHLHSGGSVAHIGLGTSIVAGSVVVNFLVSARLLNVGKRHQSSALLADAVNLRTDGIASLAILASLIAGKLTGFAWIDPLMGFAMATFIIGTALRILKDSGSRLLDETLPEDELRLISSVIEEFICGEVVGYHDLRARHVGPRHQVDFHMQFAEGTSLREAHRLGHLLQDRIMETLPGTTVLIHLEPEERVRPSLIDSKFYKIDT